MIIRHGRILEMDGKFYITKGQQYFCFFVDSEKASYTQKLAHATGFATEAEAENFLQEVRRREKQQRYSRTHCD